MMYLQKDGSWPSLVKGLMKHKRATLILTNSRPRDYGHDVIIEGIKDNTPDEYKHITRHVQVASQKKQDSNLVTVIVLGDFSNNEDALVLLQKDV